MASAQTVGGTISGAANTRNPNAAQQSSAVKPGTELNDPRVIKKLPLNGRLYDQFIILNPDNLNYTGQVLDIDTWRDYSLVTSTFSSFYSKRDGAQVTVVTSTAGTDTLHGSGYEYFRNSFLNARNYFDPSRKPNSQRNVFGATLGGPIIPKVLYAFGNYEGFRQNLGLSNVALVPDNEARQGLLPNASGVRVPVTVSPVSAQLLNLWPVANGPEVTSNGRITGIALAFNNPTQRVRIDAGSSRLDIVMGRHDSAFATYTIDDSSASTPSQNPYSIVNEALRQQNGTLQEQHNFSAKLVNTFRFSFNRAGSHLVSSVRPDIQAITPTLVPGKPTSSIIVSGTVASGGASAVTNAGANPAGDNTIARNTFTVDDHVIWTHGKHQLEFGGWIQRLQSNDDVARDLGGQAAFNSLSLFLAGSIRLFRYTPNTTGLGWRNFMGDAYVEDSYRPTPRFLVRAGFRFESSTGWSESQGRAGVYHIVNGVMDSAPTVQSNAVNQNRALFLPEPHIGIMWNLNAKGSTVLRAGAGLHHVPLSGLNYRLDQAAPFNTSNAYTATNVSNATGATPTVLPSTVALDIATPSLVTYTIRIEQQMPWKSSLSIGYLGSYGYNQILAGDLNEPAYTVLPNGTIYYPTTAKANPKLSSTLSWWSGGVSNYNALSVLYRHDLSRGLQINGSYIWSKNLDNGAAWTTSVSANTPAFVAVPSRPDLDYGPSATDISSIATINLTYQLPFGSKQPFFAKTSPIVSRLISGWSVGSIANLQTGFPFSPQLGYNPTGNGDPRNPIRPDVNPNFSGRLYTRGTTAQRVAQYFNPTAFSAPAYGTVGNAGRDSLRGPGHADWDLSLVHSGQINKRVGAQFRVDFANVLNHTNLQIPNPIVIANGPAQGTTANQTLSPEPGPGGLITATANSSRQIQISMKVSF
ncbi:MAG: carboxypeptidase regulatory-like domain-containing protein [Acidobacteriaceae bacterium]|nr:carboxypeptidase regulatory-like domain-containing protein [Acidobacteriaceae bacterium]